MTGWTPEELIGLTPPFPCWTDNRRDALIKK
ncbi:hypothetical protein [Polynucleobacter necessarius]|nr:hypothetical protein [Polynucleobacter necessarius]